MESQCKSKSSVLRTCGRILFFVILTFYFVFCAVNSRADDLSKISIDITEPEILTLTIGKSLIMKIPEAVQRVSLANPKVADVMILTPWQLYLTGKAAGTTRFTLWSGKEKVLCIYDLEVVPDVTMLKQKIYEILPIKQEDIQITATHNSISLTGSVSSADDLSDVVALAQTYAPKDKDGNPKINNFLEVRGVHQVMLEVQVSEIARSLIKKLGVNFNVMNASSGEYWINTLDNLSFLDVSDVGIPSVGISSNINMIFRFLEGNNSWLVFFDLLKDQGLLKILAEPTLITLSGKNAKFLAGGEFPIPVPQESGRGSITIEYKPFGVGLNFTPIVLENNNIYMEVSPEVSNLDFSNAVSFGGFIIPSLSVRRVSTAIELNDGQSFVIAGLLNDNIREYVRKFPMLGDIPILGSLFRSSSFQKNETELVIIVTPHLVKPVDMAKQTLPTDEYIEPDDFEFYLLGNMEGNRKASSLSFTELPSPLNDENGLEGDFGHIIP
ncbi:MAG: type II and III secretion system protein family protein [bacterium]